MRGKTLKLSAPRRLACDLMGFAMKFPRVTVERWMQLGPLLRARGALEPRPSWTVLFLKGYALLAQEVPELRRAYIKLPTPRLYEYPMSVASVAQESEFEGVQVVVMTRIKGPEERSIPELGAMLQAARSRPILENKEAQRWLWLAQAPAPIRRTLIWIGLNLGQQRANLFGTFHLSVISGLGADSPNPLSFLTTLFNYGVMGEDGGVIVRIHFDHRVMDGADIARALKRFEEILNGTIAAELDMLAQQKACLDLEREPEY
ncbi:hypothetical protein C5748_25540 [Phyllobacterium phragmitis]|uniref:2-oxo acid dehydrogenase subunit E2 n=1 Tax=Phyllobacterium phragmitis TaxID=2670329 RepID=A0A2S9IJI3_9HYPH|nr:hypothetical protein [Phyllobacterium phragmitis]PRD40691.1 hypothetical protein C5748_25540 [Phyllobacterium phragmitis]